MKMLEPDKFVEDERFSSALVKGFSTSECPINRECFGVIRGVGRKLKNVCPHFRNDDDQAYCCFEDFTEGQ